MSNETRPLKIAPPLTPEELAELGKLADAADARRAAAPGFAPETETVANAPEAEVSQ